MNPASFISGGIDYSPSLFSILWLPIHLRPPPNVRRDIRHIPQRLGTLDFQAEHPVTIFLFFQYCPGNQDLPGILEMLDLGKTQHQPWIFTGVESLQIRLDLVLLVPELNLTLGVGVNVDFGDPLLVEIVEQLAIGSENAVAGDG